MGLQEPLPDMAVFQIRFSVYACPSEVDSPAGLVRPPPHVFLFKLDYAFAARQVKHELYLTSRLRRVNREPGGAARAMQKKRASEHLEHSEALVSVL